MTAAGIPLLPLREDPVILSMRIAGIAERDWPALTRCLPPEEHARARAFRQRADRRSFVAAHALLRLGLSAGSRIDPAKWTFAADVWGKPSLVPGQPNSDVLFNLSHTRQMVAVGFARRVMVGVDTEPLDRLADADLDAITRWLSPDEQAGIAARGVEGRPARVIDLWTLKEAVTKALGRGLSLPLASFSIDPDRLRITGIEGDWRLAKWTRHGHRIAAALLGATRPPVHYHVAVSTACPRPDIHIV